MTTNDGAFVGAPAGSQGVGRVDGGGLAGLGRGGKGERGGKGRVCRVGHVEEGWSEIGGRRFREKGGGCVDVCSPVVHRSRSKTGWENQYSAGLTTTIAAVYGIDNTVKNHSPHKSTNRLIHPPTHPHPTSSPSPKSPHLIPLTPPPQPPNPPSLLNHPNPNPIPSHPLALHIFHHTYFPPSPIAPHLPLPQLSRSPPCGLIGYEAQIMGWRTLTIELRVGGNGW